MARKPEQTAEVYQLGHWEVMQIGLAFELAELMLKPEYFELLEPSVRDTFELLELRGIERFDHIFTTPGNVTILKEVEG